MEKTKLKNKDVIQFLGDHTSKDDLLNYLTEILNNDRIAEDEYKRIINKLGMKEVTYTLKKKIGDCINVITSILGLILVAVLLFKFL